MADGSAVPSYLTFDLENPIINIDKVEFPITLSIKIIGILSDYSFSSEVI